MCCIQIGDETLIKNVLGSPEIKKLEGGKISADDIGKCGIYLRNNLPGYVDCEIDGKMLEHAALACGYKVDNRQVYFEDIDIDRTKCNQMYPEELADKIEGIVDGFFYRELYRPEKVIKNMKYVYAN